MYIFFKAVALSMSTAIQSLLLVLLSPSTCPFYSSDTGLWSFKAITMALMQALNRINLLKTPKTSTFPPSPSVSSD